MSSFAKGWELKVAGGYPRCRVVECVWNVKYTSTRRDGGCLLLLVAMRCLACSFGGKGRDHKVTWSGWGLR